MGVFPGSSPAIFIGPVVTRELLDLHEKICNNIDDLGETIDSAYYRPEHWVPHCALAIEFDNSKWIEAIQMSQHLLLPLEGNICDLGLVEMRPVRHLGCWSLKRNENA